MSSWLCNSRKRQPVLPVVCRVGSAGTTCDFLIGWELITPARLQNSKTKFNSEADKAVKEFLATPGYQPRVNVIKADPVLADSADFLQQANITSTITEATIVFLMPPGRIVNVHSGKIAKTDLEASMQSHAPDGSCCPAPAPAKE